MAALRPPNSGRELVPRIRYARALAIAICFLWLASPALGQPSIEPRRPARAPGGLGLPESADSPLPPAIDERRAAAHGIRRVAGKRLVLFTDVESSPEVDELPAVFDQAFDQWCAYFNLDASRYPDWQMTGYIMQAKERFEAAGLAPADLPPFRNGFTRNHEFWMYDQSSPYYRRHLLLHEGVHGFTFTLLGSCGTPWYTEGIAELLATHRWEDGNLTTNYFPQSPEEVPRLSRIELVLNDVRQGKSKSLDEVLEFGPKAHLQNEAYGWCWAAAAFLDNHPRYRDRFRKLKRHVTARDFNGRVRQLFGRDWKDAQREWSAFTAALAYGYDFQRTAIDWSPGKPFAARSKVTVAADRGWQNTGLQLKAKTRYRVRATGRFQVAETGKPWFAEAGGVSIRYVQGRPLGMLLGVVVPDQTSSPDFDEPVSLGTRGEFAPTATGTLYLRVNDSAGELADNNGELKVTIEPLSE